MWETARDSEDEQRPADKPVPGLLLVFHGQRPLLRALPVTERGLVLGRELLGELTADDRLSRQHARIEVRCGQFTVADLGSRNGTHVDGAPVERPLELAPPVVLRAGRTLGVLLPDLRRYQGARVERRDGAVVGPTLAAAWAEAERAARTSRTLLLTGESGTGKELAARAFHRATGAAGELVAVNCAAIPAGVAERLLFGARRGAYSGVDRDAEGYFDAAEGGTLFLDEIGELEPAVQAKLLRAIDAREITAVGASRPRSIDVRVVAATLRSLPAEVAAGRFRDDLYYRLGRPQVTLPPLRHRVDDLPELVTDAVHAVAPALTPHATLVEACLLRRWPGNARELIAELTQAAARALEAGAQTVRASDLAPGAGELTAPTAAWPRRTAGPAPAAATAERPSAAAPLPSLAAVTEALRAERGNKSRAARALGLHRNQLRRLLERHPELAAGADAELDPDPQD